MSAWDGPLWFDPVTEPVDKAHQEVFIANATQCHLRVQNDRRQELTELHTRIHLLETRGIFRSQQMHDDCLDKLEQVCSTLTKGLTALWS